RPDAAAMLPRLRDSSTKSIGARRCRGRFGSTHRRLDPRPIAVRDLSKYTIFTLPKKARCSKCGADRGSVRAADLRSGVQQATSHVWPKKKEAANLGRPRLD